MQTIRSVVLRAIGIPGVRRACALPRSATSPSPGALPRPTTSHRTCFRFLGAAVRRAALDGAPHRV